MVAHRHNGYIFGVRRWTIIPLRMPFGLANAPSNFQRTMNYALSDLIDDCAMCYIDDVVIFSKTPEEHKYHLEQVFERLAQAGLKLKMSKCDFAKPEVKLLGYLVNKDGIKTNNLPQTCMRSVVF